MHSVGGGSSCELSAVPPSHPMSPKMHQPLLRLVAPILFLLFVLLLLSVAIVCRAAAYDQQAIIDLIKSNSLIESSSTSAVARARSNNNNKKDEMNRLEALLKLVNEQPQKKTSHFSPADDPELDMSTVRLHVVI